MNGKPYLDASQRMDKPIHPIYELRIGLQRADRHVVHVEVDLRGGRALLNARVHPLRDLNRFHTFFFEVRKTVGFRRAGAYSESTKVGTHPRRPPSFQRT